MSDQPAWNANGNLRDAADMKFYESESDTRPLPAPSARKDLFTKTAWLHEIRVSKDFFAGKLGKTLLMLILDVKTRWSSTHQMLRRALDYRKIINGFASRFLVHPHNFLRFQDNLRLSIHKLPLSPPSALWNGLIEAHRKLSDYYDKSGESPYYMWAARLKHDFRHDDDLLNDLEDAKTKLDEYFRRNYTDTVSSTPVQSTSSPRVQSTSCIQSSLQKGFTERYRMQPSITVQP
ncbi:hypothetical protein B0H17DRAFT_1135918 [Mycena rosella]|uniref:Uncharacterized protein n=1 Tax=Mycena rosella TaxID=1033263 RepID=A0AAD7DDQ0_MYCRO|nr:hypothetical protein B0H17DRAFT_1135918 [Mycena rosella]